MSARKGKTTSIADRYSPPAKRVKRWLRISRFRGQQSWVLDLLRKIERDYADRASGASDADFPPGWLLRYRPQFRRVDASEPAAAIRLYLLDCPDQLTPVAIWLLGRCATRTNLYDLLEFAVPCSASVRRHAARALRRSEAWSQLGVLAANTPDDRRIKWYSCAPTTKRPFRERLKSLSAHMDHSHEADAAGPSRMALWFADIDWIRRPPKSLEYIRSILQRIHRWVHRTE